MRAAEAVVEDPPRARGLPKAVQCEASTKSVPVLDRGFDESPHRHHHGAPGDGGVVPALQRLNERGSPDAAWSAVVAVRCSSGPAPSPARTDFSRLDAPDWPSNITSIEQGGHDGNADRHGSHWRFQASVQPV